MRRSVAVIVAAMITVEHRVTRHGLGRSRLGRRNGQADPAGVINFPADLTAQGGFKLDPITVSWPNDWFAQQYIYDSLLRQNADGSYSPGLAKSATVVDPLTIEVVLQPNVKFSDKTPMDAEAVKFSIERNMASGNVGAVPCGAAPDRVDHGRQPHEVDDRAQDPIAGQFYNLLANSETMIVSPTAVQSGTSLDRRPVGEGPFMLESYTPERSVKFVKNPDYFQAKKIKLGGIQIVQVTQTDPQATVNALLDHVADTTSAP